MYREGDCGDGRTIRSISRTLIEYCNRSNISIISIEQYSPVYLQNSKFLRNFLRKFNNVEDMIWQ